MLMETVTVTSVESFDPRETGATVVATICTESGSVYTIRPRRSPVGLVTLEGPKFPVGQALIGERVRRGAGFTIWRSGSEVHTSRVASITLTTTP